MREQVQAHTHTHTHTHTIYIYIYIYPLEFGIGLNLYCCYFLHIYIKDLCLLKHANHGMNPDILEVPNENLTQ